MRRKQPIGPRLLAVTLAIVGPPFVALSVRPYEPPLRVSMKPAEAASVLGNAPCTFGSFGTAGGVIYYHVTYPPAADWIGTRKRVVVTYGNNGAERWEVEPLTWATPAWVDKALKWIG